MRLMTIEKFILLDKNKKIKYSQNNIKNMVHQKGEQYMLDVLFMKGTVAGSYYAGLDNRATLDVSDTITSLSGEPFNGYSRIQIESWEGPILTNGVYVVKSGFLTFSGVGTGWGPVRNIFLSTSRIGGILISSARLSQSVSVAANDSIVMVMNLSLTNQ